MIGVIAFLVVAVIVWAVLVNWETFFSDPMLAFWVGLAAVVILGLVGLGMLVNWLAHLARRSRQN
jgi:hypothetical protein